MPNLPPPQVPSIFPGRDLRETPTIFFTRMDPRNSKDAIAFNNYSDAWMSKLRNVEAWIAFKLVPGPYLLEKTVQKGKVFRNIVTWTGGALPTSLAVDMFPRSNLAISYSVAANTPIHLPPPPQLMLNMFNDLYQLQFENQSMMKEKYEELIDKMMAENRASEDRSLQDFQCEFGPHSR